MEKWCTRSQEDKLKLVKKLADVRLELAKQAASKRRSVGKKERAKKPVITSFASDEHKRLYDSLPPDARKLLFGA